MKARLLFALLLTTLLACEPGHEHNSDGSHTQAEDHSHESNDKKGTKTSHKKPARGATHMHDNPRAHLRSPHEGKIIDRGNYHLELVGGRELKVYLLDAKLKTLPISKASGGEVVIEGSEGEKMIELLPDEGNYLAASLPFNTAEDKAVIKLTIDGKTEYSTFGR